MNTLTDKSFEDYKQAKKEMDALETLYRQYTKGKLCEEMLLSEKAAEEFDIDYKYTANQLFAIIEDWFKNKNK